MPMRTGSEAEKLGFTKGKVGSPSALGDSIAAVNPACGLVRPGPDATASGVGYIPDFAVEEFDTGSGVGMHDNAVNPSRITIQVAGVYNVAIKANIAASGVGMGHILLLVNGASGTIGASAPNQAAEDFNLSASGQLKLAVGDYLQLSVLQTSGGALNASAMRLSAVRVAGG